MLNLMYITKRPEVAQIAETAGINWIFVDMEFIGKDSRQGGLDTVKNHHTIDDIRIIKNALNGAEVMVRINPIHDELPDYCSSMEEINCAIAAGADILMLPYFHTVETVKEFIRLVGGRVKTCLLLETPEAAILIDDILQVPGIDMIHIGLNDMHLALGRKFMFELLADGTVDKLAAKIKQKNIPFGFGGIATLDGGALSGSMVLKEHYRLGSSMVIVSRSFCNTDIVTDLDEIRSIFNEGVKAIRDLEESIKDESETYFETNHIAVVETVNRIIQ